MTYDPMDDWCLIDFMDLDSLAERIIEVRVNQGRAEGRLWEVSYPNERYWAHPVFCRKLIASNDPDLPLVYASRDPELMDRILEGLEAGLHGDATYIDTLPTTVPLIAHQWVAVWEGRVRALAQGKQLEEGTAAVGGAVARRNRL